MNITVPEKVTLSGLVSSNNNMTSLTGFHAVTFESAPGQERVIEQTDVGTLLLDVPVRSIGPLRVDTHSEGTVHFTKLPDPIAFEVDGGALQFTLRKFERKGIHIEQLSGEANVTFESNENENRSQFGAVNIRGDLIFDQASIDVDGPLVVTGVVGHSGYGRDLVLHSDGNELGHVKMGAGATLTLNGTTTAKSAALPIHTNLIGNSNLTITEHIDLQAGTIDFSNGQLIADEIRKTTSQHAFIKDLGEDFQGQVMLEGGLLKLQSAKSLGNGRITLMNPETSILIDSDDGPLLGTIDFNNSKANGGHQSSIEGEFAGSLLLGEIGSVFSSRRVELSGPVSGGDLVISAQAQGPTFMSMRGNHVGHVGETIVQGSGHRNSASFHLFDAARISESSRIVLENGGQLSVSSGEQEYDNVADSIPILMKGGFLDVSGTSERFGGVHVASGFNRIGSGSFNMTVGLSSLTIEPQAALQFAFRKDEVKIDIESLGNTDFLGGNVTSRSGSAPRFAKYDSQRGVVDFTEADMNVGDPNTWQPSDHVGVRNAALEGDTTVESLTLLFDHDVNTRLSTGKNMLNIRSGGLIGFPHAVIAGSGKLTAGGQSPNATLFMHLDEADSMRISTSITDNPGPDGQYDSAPNGPLNADNGKVDVVYAGENAAVYVSGQNTYTGETIINGIGVRYEKTSAIPPNSHITINGGGLENIADSEILYSPSIRLKSGILRGKFETPLLTVESGVANEIVGSGHIVKTTRGFAQLFAPTFDGTVDIQDGTLVIGSSSTGNPTFNVQANGTLESAGPLSGNIRLSGGRLASAHGNDPLTIPRGSQVIVANDSRIQSYVPNAPVELGEVITIEHNGALSLLGPATVSLNGIVLGDNTSLNAGSPLVLGGSVFVGQNTTIESENGSTVDFELNGKLIAASQNSRLNFVGLQNTDDFFNRTIEVPANTSLAVTVDGTENALRITGENNLLKGGGRIKQSLALDAGVSVLVGDDDTIGTLSVDGDFSMNTGSLVFDFLDAKGEIGTGWDAIEVGEQLKLPASDAFRLVVQGAAERGTVLNFDPSRSERWQLVSGSVSNPDAISNARLATRGFGESSLPRGGGLSAVADENGIYLEYRFVLGDFNGNGTIDAGDIDRLSRQVRSEVYESDFDLVEDGQLDTFDHEFWVDSIANTYYGDANLDGEFNSSDFTMVFSAARYETGAAEWSSGDWNGDGVFDSSDFVVAFKQGGYERGPRRAAVVPEPTASCLTLFIVLAVSCTYRSESAQPI
ncbi:hypothetical protein ACFL2H_01410 [Planctomycetota bacterium]